MRMQTRNEGIRTRTRVNADAGGCLEMLRFRAGSDVRFEVWRGGWAGRRAAHAPDRRPADGVPRRIMAAVHMAAARGRFAGGEARAPLRAGAGILRPRRCSGGGGRGWERGL